MEKNNIRVGYWDFLKGVAISLIILSHFAARLPELNPVISMVGLYDQMGCQLFFIISAYFCMVGLSKQQIKFVTFLENKLRRLMPEYLCAMMLHIPVIIFLRDFLNIEMNWPRTDPANIFANIFLMQHWCNFGSFNTLVTGSWFIAVLIFFYALACLGFSTKIFNGKNIHLLILGSTAVTLIGGIVLSHFGGSIANNSAWYASIFTQLPVLLLGVKYYYSEQSINFGNNVYRLLLVVVLYLVTMLLFFGGWKYAFLMLPILVGIMFYNFIPIIQGYYVKWGGKNGCITRVFEAFGNYSYEMMFMHIYPITYGTRMVRVLTDSMGIHMSGTVLFWMLLVPWFLISYLMAFMMRKVLQLAGRILTVNGSC